MIADGQGIRLVDLNHRSVIVSTKSTGAALVSFRFLSLSLTVFIPLTPFEAQKEIFGTSYL